MKLKFQRNLGVKDRIIRIVTGLILLVLIMVKITPVWMVSPFLYIAGIIMIEAMIGY